MKMEKNKTQEPTNISKLDAVKELIFGQNMQEYDQKFETIEQLIDQKFKQLTEQLNTLEKANNLNLDQAKSELNNKLDQLSNDKLDRSKLANLLRSLADKIE